MESKILVLGANGMTGRIVYAYLLRKNPTFGTVRKNAGKRLLRFDFPRNNSALENFISDNKINVVINCIGVLKNGKSFETNYLLAVFLAKLSKKYNFRIINISTDDVFRATAGKVNENSKPDPDNPYGKSKLKGEIKSPNIINVRTSLIGFDPLDKKGLIEWQIGEKGKIVEGYTNQIWSGCTTLQFAKLCEDLIEKANYQTLHFAPLGPMTKYELLKEISASLRLGTEVKKSMSEEINRKLTSMFFDRRKLKKYTTDTKKAILELDSFEKTL